MTFDSPALTRRDVRGRRRLTLLGYLALGVLAFTLIAGASYAIFWQRSGKLESAAQALPTVTVAPSSPTTLPSPTPAPTEIPTGTPVPVPYPITWTVHSFQTTDGRVAFMVDQPGVLETARRHYMEFWAFFAFQEGLPDDATFKAKLDFYTVEGPSREGLILRVDEYRHNWLGYWRKALPTDLVWVDDLVEFSADGSQVVMTLVFPEGVISGEWFDLEVGGVTHYDTNDELVLRITMVYDPWTGRWKTQSDKRVN